MGIYGHAVVDLRGTKTDIHFNKRHGTCIHASSRAKVNIHLPFQHNTGRSHDNVGEDQHQEGGGSIANINTVPTVHIH